MKRLFVVLAILLVFCAYGCEKRTCRCVDAFGGVQEGIELVPFEECSDLEPMMGTCTEE